MAKLKETTQQKKLRRNQHILERYNILKQMMTCREAQKLLEDEFALSPSTITKILFVPGYSMSPIATTVAMLAS